MVSALALRPVDLSEGSIGEIDVDVWVDVDVSTSAGAGATLLAFLLSGHNLIGLEGVGRRAAVPRNVAVFLFGVIIM
jgi:hypothetical protein